MPAYKYKTQSGKTLWRAVIRYEDWQGEKKETTKRGFAKKREAEEWIEQFMRQNQADTHMTMNEFYELYMRDLAPTIKVSSLENKKQIIESKILPYFGNKEISRILPRDIIQWQNVMRSLKSNKGEPFSQGYLKSIHNQIVALFSHAYRFYGLLDNPMNRVPALGSAVDVKHDIWTEEEYQKVAEELMGDPNPYNYYAGEVLFWTGLRIGELLALTPEDVDLENRTITVSKNYYKGKDGTEYVTTPKTRKGNIMIKIPEFLAEELKECMELYYDIGPHDRIFQTTSKDVFNRAKDKAAKKAGVKRIKIHEFRHSHASMLTDMVIPDNAIADRMGHKTVRMTQYYSHSYAKRQDEMADRLEQIHKGGEGNVG